MEAPMSLVRSFLPAIPSLLLFALAGCQGAGPALPLDYPDTRSVYQTDDYFGTVLPYPYLCMEDMEAP